MAEAFKIYVPQNVATVALYGAQKKKKKRNKDNANFAKGFSSTYGLTYWLDRSLICGPFGQKQFVQITIRFAKLAPSTWLVFSPPPFHIVVLPWQLSCNEICWSSESDFLIVRDRNWLMTLKRSVDFGTFFYFKCRFRSVACCIPLSYHIHPLRSIYSATFLWPVGALCNLFAQQRADYIENTARLFFFACELCILLFLMDPLLVGAQYFFRVYISRIKYSWMQFVF